MAEVDTSFYRVQPKSYFDYLQEMAGAEDAKAARERNKLSTVLLQGQVQDATQARDQRNRLQQAFQGLGGNASDEDVLKAYRSAGDVAGAAGYQESMLKRQGEQAKIAKDTAEAEKTKLATLHSKVDRHTQLLASVQSPQELAQWVMQGVQDGVMDQAKAQQLLSQPPRTPQELDTLKAKMQAGGQTITQQIEQIWKQKGYDLQVQQAGETQRHNKASEGLTARGQNMTDERARETNDVQRSAARSQVVETPDGVMIVDKGTGLAKPAATANGQALPGKQPESVKKALTEINQQKSIVQGAIDAAAATPDAFGMKRGLATLGGTISESVVGRFDSDAERQARAYVFNNVSKVINERAGAAQSAQEMARLRSFLPGETDNSEQIVSKLKAFQKYLGDMESGTKGGPANSSSVDDLVNKYRSK